jgi:hypothetical protein
MDDFPTMNPSPAIVGGFQGESYALNISNAIRNLHSYEKLAATISGSSSKIPYTVR